MKEVKEATLIQHLPSHPVWQRCRRLWCLSRRAFLPAPCFKEFRHVANAEPSAATTTTGCFQRTHVRQLNSWPIWRWAPRPFFICTYLATMWQWGGFARHYLMLSKEAVIEHKDCVKWQAFCEWQELQVLSLASDTMCHTVPHPHKTDQAQQSFDQVQLSATQSCQCSRVYIERFFWSINLWTSKNHTDLFSIGKD